MTYRPPARPDMLGPLPPITRRLHTRRDVSLGDLVSGTYAGGRDPWIAAHLDTMPEHLRQLVAVELHATAQTHWHPTHILGQLQHREYAAAVISGAYPGRSPREIQRLIRFRMLRAERFLETRARAAEMIIDESALYRCPAGDDVLATQLRHLLDIVESHCGIRVRVLPYGAAAAVPTPISYYRDPYESAVYLELHHDAKVTTDRDTVSRYFYALEHLTGQALDVDASRVLVHERWESLCAKTRSGGGHPRTPPQGTVSRSESRPAESG